MYHPLTPPPGSEERISDEVKEIISWRPHWMVRRGNMVFAAILLSMLVLSYFIAYPDVVSGTARLVMVNVPKPVRAKADGKLEQLFVRNEEVVQKGQPLGYLEATARYNEVVLLHNWVNKTIAASGNGDYGSLLSYPLPNLVALGELQTAYQGLANQVTETIQILARGYYQRKRTALQQDLAFLKNLKNNALQQQQLLLQDQQLQQQEYKAYESLAQDKVIAPLELNQYKSKLLAKEQSLRQAGTLLTNSDIASHGKQKELLELQKQVLDQQQKFHSALLGLKSDIEKWMQQYVFKAPEAGKVLFWEPLQEAQSIGMGQELFYIQPPGSGVHAQLAVGQKGFGKVREGQKVLLKMDGYPSETFGYLEGKIVYIAAMPNRRDSFWVRADLPNGLQTSGRQQIGFRNNASGAASIITDDRSLLQRFAGTLHEVLRR